MLPPNANINAILEKNIQKNMPWPPVISGLKIIHDSKAVSVLLQTRNV